ncbi:MAG TPA: single-stranded-DNA-specific exonuclease RecJ [Opitutales bacterium]|nr:single-stranded-DNA-specific exonuclease RecJ [Opitutales bacterium]
MIRWHCPTPPASATALAEALEVSPVLAGLLASRGLREAAMAEPFLRPKLAALDDPFRVPNLEAAAKLLDETLAAGRTIAIFGDYDVDGVTSTALLVNVLRAFGAQPRFAVPRRLEEGYGLSRAAIDRVLADGAPDLFIALDCGTNAIAEVALLRERGCQVIIVDHHKPKGGVPLDSLLINPHADATAGAPWSQLCTVGLVFKLTHGLVKLRRAANDPRAAALRLADTLDLVALGTVADLVPLEGENRILARHGMRILEKCARPGLRALFAVSGLQPGQTLAASDISYRLGPRINASGRLADAALPVELLLDDQPDSCRRAAMTLETLNRERQNIERQVAAEAERLVEETQRDAPALVVYGETWHPGVVGIVAGKLCRQYARPCIVLGREGPLAKGSGRSIPGLNLVEALQPCAEFLAHWGGHPMAVGISLDAARLTDFHAAFSESVRTRRAALIEDSTDLEIAAWLEPADLNEDLLRDLELLHPYGEGNPEPVFGVRGVRLTSPEIFGGSNYRCWVPNGKSRVAAVAWKKAGELPPAQTPLDLAAKFSWNFWNGRQYPQLEILHWRAAE